MALRFRCGCGRKLKAPDGTAGKRAKCPACASWLRVPDSATYETIAESVPAPSAAHGPAHEDHPEMMEGTADKPRVVLASSSKDESEYIRQMLLQHGYHVIHVSSGHDALDAIRAEQPQAAVIDLKLEGLSGFQVVEQIRNPLNVKNAAVWKMPIIMTTDKLRGRDKQYSMSLGIQAFLTKPLTPASLCSRLEKEIGRQPPASP